MSETTGAAGIIGPKLDPCGVHDRDAHLEMVKVTPNQRINITFTSLPPSLQPPFTLSHAFYLPRLTLCNIGPKAGVPNATNQTWWEWEVHAFESYTDYRGANETKGMIGQVGDTFIFSIYQAQSNDSLAQYPYWLSANYTIVDSKDGGGAYDARGHQRHAVCANSAPGFDSAL